MEYLRLLYELPAIVSGTTILAYMSPWKIAHRFMPLIMFLMALLVLQVPEFISLAMCLAIPAAYLQAKLGIDLHSHDPLKIKLPAVRKPKFELRQFVTKAYPSPDEQDAEPEEAPEEDEAPPEHEDNEQVTAVKKYVPSLLD